MKLGLLLGAVMALASAASPKSTAPFYFVWPMAGPRRQNVPMPALCSSVGLRPGRSSRPCKSGAVRWVFLGTRHCKASPRKYGTPASEHVRRSAKSFWHKWSKAVLISTSVVWSSISYARSKSGMCGTTAIANMAVTTIAPRATTCALELMECRANSDGRARRQRLLRNGFYRHGGVHRQTGGAASVSNGKITTATMGMNGSPTRAIHRCLSYAPRYHPRYAHTTRPAYP